MPSLSVAIDSLPSQNASGGQSADRDMATGSHPSCHGPGTASPPFASRSLVWARGGGAHAHVPGLASEAERTSVVRPKSTSFTAAPSSCAPRLAAVVQECRRERIATEDFPHGWCKGRVAPQLPEALDRARSLPSVPLLYNTRACSGAPGIDSENVLCNAIERVKRGADRQSERQFGRRQVSVLGV